MLHLWIKAAINRDRSGNRCGRILASSSEPRPVLIVGSVRVLERGKVGALRGVVRLEDVSFADAPSRILATTSISMPLGVSQARFRLVVDPTLDPKRSYLIGAVLEGEEEGTGRKRVFGTTVAHPWEPSSTNDLTIEVRPWD